MITDTLRALRRQAAQLRSGQGRRYPAKLKERIVAAVGAGRDEGWCWDRLSTEFGIPAETLKRWWRDADAAGDPVLVAVDIDDDVPVAGGAVSVVTPSGFRVDGLDVDGAARLIRALS